MNVKKIAVFASGSGTNAQAIIQYFAGNQNIVVDSLWSNNPKAYALVRAENLGIEAFTFNREQFYEKNEVVENLKNRSINLVVLAGFLWLVPENLIDNFPVINIHPALLPKYGGRGMYGMRVHQAVVDNKDTETGISIHIVNKNYDEGELIFQTTCEVLPYDSPEDVARKVHDLEYAWYPKIIENYIGEV
jgi:phosphoribosylglycinamide formyltransferase 1